MILLSVQRLSPRFPWLMFSMCGKDHNDQEVTGARKTLTM
jgi:hypothetical protein